MSKPKATLLNGNRPVNEEVAELVDAVKLNWKFNKNG